METHNDRFRRIVEGIERAGIVNYAFVGVDSTGEAFWGANFGQHQQALLSKLAIMEKDIRAYQKRAALPAQRKP
jgi:hypothetical protein